MGQPAPSKVRLNEQVTFPGRRRSTGLILLLILSLAAGLRLVHLSQVPSGLHQDEAANAWNAWCLLKTGKDQAGVHWPVFYSRCLGANRSTPYLYALLPLQAIGGLSVWTTRLPSAIGGVVAVLLTFYVATRLFGPVTGLVAAGLMAVNPWHLQLSRWGHEAGLCQLLVMASMAALLWANMPFDDEPARRPRVRVAAFAGGLVGLCCYGYPAIRIFLPVFLAAAVALTWRGWRRQLGTYTGRQAIWALVITGAVTFGPLVWMHLAYPDQIARRAGQVWVWGESDPIGTKVVRTLARYPGHFGWDFLFVPGELGEFRFPSGVGQFHWYAGPMMALGAVVVVRRFRSAPAARVLLAWVLLYPVGDLLFGRAGLHALRSFPGAAGLVLLSAVGVVSALSWLRERHRLVAAGAVCVMAIAVVSLNVRFLHGYFGAYSRHPDIFRRFHVDFLEACEWVRPRLDEIDALFVTGQGAVQPYIITLVGLQYEPQQWFRDAPLALTTGDWDVYPGYGKVHFLLGDLGHAPLRALADNGRPDRVMFIVRPGDLGFEKPVHEIRAPDGHPTLWICEEIL